MYQMNDFGLAEIFENLYICINVTYKILDQTDKRLNFKKFGIGLCAKL